MATTHETVKNIDAIVQKLNMAEAAYQKVLAVAEKLANVQYNAPNVGSGAPSYVTNPSTGGVPSNTTAGLHQSATSAPPAGPTPASQSAASQMNFRVGRGGVTYSDLSASAQTQVNAALGLGGSGAPPSVPPAAAINPNAIQVSLIQSAQSGAAYNPYTVSNAMASASSQSASNIANFSRLTPAMYNRLAATGAGFGYVGVDAIAGSAYLQSAAIRAGGTVDAMPMEAMGTGYRLGGGLIGAGLGLLTGSPILATLLAMGGAEVGGAVGKWLGAPMQNQTDILGILKGQGGAFSGMSSGYGFQGRLSRFEEMQRLANRTGLPASLRFSETASPELAKAFASVNAGLIAGGIDPYLRSDTGRVYSPGSAELERAAEIYRRDGAGVRGHFEGAIGAIKWISGAGREQIGEAYTRRLASIFGNPGVSAASQRVSPIFGTLPETGGNIADILGQYGPADTSLFLRIQNDRLQSSVNTGDLMFTSATVRGQRRRLQFASTLPYDQGAVSASIYQDQMSTLAALPGGAESLEYARARAGFREGRTMQFGQELSIASLKARGSGTAAAERYARRVDELREMGLTESVEYAEAVAGRRSAAGAALSQRLATGYDIPLTRARADLARQMVAPYRPGAVAGQQLDIARGEISEAGDINAWIDRQRAAGMLSEEDELRWTSRAAALSTSGHTAVGSLSQGGPDWIGSISTNRVRGFGRFNQMQMAARFVGAAAPWRRDLGFMGGGQEQASNAFWGDSAAGPYSRTAGVNSGASMDRNTAALNRMAAALEKLGMGGGRGSGFAPDGGRFRMPGDVDVN